MIIEVVPFSFKFGLDADKNHTYCVQDPKIKGFKILAPDKKEVMYIATTKSAMSSRTEYIFKRAIDNVELATLSRQKNPKEYIIKGSRGENLGNIKFSDKRIDLEIVKDHYKASVENRAQAIEFRDKADKSVLTIDKKIISLKDDYHITGVPDFPHLIAQILAVAIDDFYHDGAN